MMVLSFDKHSNRNTQSLLRTEKKSKTVKEVKMLIGDVYNNKN